MRVQRVQLLVTQRCNARCDQCDKAVGYAKIDLEYTAAMMAEHTQQMHDQHIHLRKMTISGGEPVMNAELQDILFAAPPVSEGRLLTNGLPSTQAKRDAITLPPNWRWIPAPLDNPSDPLSGKSIPQETRPRVHHTYWVSPADYGFSSEFEKCGTKYWCGRGLDAGGWSMCGQAPILGKLLGVDPYPADPEVDILSHVMTPVPEICKHCKYGLTRTEQKQMDRVITDPVSPTFQRAFEVKTWQLSPLMN